MYSTAARQPLPIILLLDVISNLGLALIPARHHQTEHSRRQHLARRPVRVGPGRAEKLAGGVRQEVVL